CHCVCIDVGHDVECGGRANTAAAGLRSCWLTKRTFSPKTCRIIAGERALRDRLCMGVRCDVGRGGSHRLHNCPPYARVDRRRYGTAAGSSYAATALAWPACEFEWRICVA